MLENYNECLHCPTVHPELVAVAPAFRKGNIFEEGRGDYGVTMAGGGSGYTKTGTTTLPAAARARRARCDLDVRRLGVPEHVPRHDRHGRDRHPAAAARPAPTTIVTDYLFRPEAIAAPDFDPSDVIEFSELVAHQDYTVCERVQRGCQLTGLQPRRLRREGRAAVRVQPALPRVRDGD